MDIAAPTFNSLNKPQKRALILRDQLRYVDPKHLNEFLEGVINDEPPTYTKINGVIKPELTFVTLKEKATRFDLGNVLLPENNNAIQRVYLVVDNGEIQMRAEDPLPQDENVPDSLPIHGFIARGTVPLFREKFQAIYTRMNSINEARRAAYKMPNQAPVLFHEGETVARLDPSQAEQDRADSQSRKPRKREPNAEVTPHVSNRRKRKGLDIIPEDAKSKTFDTVSSHVKVDLFNSIVKTAFPNFDNLMIASWNIISIYTECGSDFPELHRAIIELKSVLQDFDEAFGSRVDRAAPKYRHDFGGPSHARENDEDNLNRSPRRQGHLSTARAQHSGEGKDEDRSPLTASSANENVGGAADHTHGSAVSDPVQQRNESIALEDNPEQAEYKHEPNVAVWPPILQTQRLEAVGGEREADDDNDDQIPHMDPRLSSRANRHSGIYQYGPRYMAKTHLGGSTPSSTRSPPTQRYSRIASERVKRPREQSDKVDAAEREEILPQFTISELARLREEQESSIDKAGALPSHQKVISPPTAKSSNVDETELGSQHEQYPSLFDEEQHDPIPPSTPTPPPKKQKKKHDLSESAKPTSSTPSAT
ncbi:hypothetical protein TW65_98124 [Stemphylium lycopersici]|nr:hypothetical protein TW65_98124 [Stemphylium lycopersici]